MTRQSRGAANNGGSHKFITALGELHGRPAKHGAEGGGGGRGGSQASDWITSRLAIVQSELWRVLLLLLLRLLAHWHRCRGSARPRGRLAVRRC